MPLRRHSMVAVPLQAAGRSTHRRGGGETEWTAAGRVAGAGAAGAGGAVGSFGAEGGAWAVAVLDTDLVRGAGAVPQAKAAESGVAGRSEGRSGAASAAEGGESGGESGAVSWGGRSGVGAMSAGARSGARSDGAGASPPSPLGGPAVRLSLQAIPRRALLSSPSECAWRRILQ